MIDRWFRCTHCDEFERSLRLEQHRVSILAPASERQRMQEAIAITHREQRRAIDQERARMHRDVVRFLGMDEASDEP